MFNKLYKFLPMTGFKPRTFGIGSDRSTNWVTTTAQTLILFKMFKANISTVKFFYEGLGPGGILPTYTYLYLFDCNDALLFIPELLYSDSGFYTCQARSSSGQAVWSASLMVADPSDPDAHFKSMPYFSQFPASPSMPSFVNATGTSITVAWDKPHRIGGSPLKGYQVLYSQRPSVQVRLASSLKKSI